MTDDELMAAIEDATLAAENFRHADHVRMGFVYMSRYDGLEGMRRFSDALQRYARAIGKATLYHETITWAYLLLIRERLARSPGPSWEAFAAANPDLLTWVLGKYYTDKTLMSELAKRTFVMPDRQVV